jgi:DNA-binding MltR family transcriptional regulator
MDINLASYLERFGAESDRGAVLISAALLDEILRSLIELFMVDDKKEIDELLGNDEKRERPLSSFGSRIRTAYCLGLISHKEFHELRIIQDLRNKFAHKIDTSSFNDKKIGDKCNSFLVMRKKPISGTWIAKSKFLYTVGTLKIMMESRIRKLMSERRKIPSVSDAI